MEKRAKVMDMHLTACSRALLSRKSFFGRFVDTGYSQGIAAHRAHDTGYPGEKLHEPQHYIRSMRRTHVEVCKRLSVSSTR